MTVAELFIYTIGVVIAAVFAVTTLGLLADMARRLVREAVVMVRPSRDEQQPPNTQGVQRI